LTGPVCEIHEPVAVVVLAVLAIALSQAFQETRALFRVFVIAIAIAFDIRIGPDP
jgi:hypothetical protein